jgi:anaerobic magnesium-protoporphyrin IX monomethyl ester cyclase
MLFVNPIQERFGGILWRYIAVGIPIAIGVLSAYLRKFGVKNIKVIDEEMEHITEENLPGLLEGLERPLIVGITVLTAEAGRAYKVSKMIRKAEPDCTIIMGGVHVTALPNEPLEIGAADIVVRGEGEETLRELYFALREGKSWSQVPGITYINDKDEVITNPDNTLIDNLDDIPMFPYELFENPRYDLGVITGARGCPFKCTYCSQRLLTGLTYRWHSTERIVENLTLLVNKYHQTSVNFYDDIFSINKRRVIDLCEGIIAAGLHKKCNFSVQTRADSIHEDLLPIMKKANFTTVGIGMETGVERIALETNKEQTVAQHLETAELCKKYGIKVSFFMIFGFPGETKEDRDETFRVVNGADVGYVKFNNLIPYPGTAIYDIAQKEGRLHIEPGWTNFNSTLSVTRSIFSTIPLAYAPEGTTEFELKRDIVKRNLQYFFKWKIIKKILLRDKGVGWFNLPPQWYFKPYEVLALTKITMVLVTNLIFSFLPPAFGNFVFSLVKKDVSITPPSDIKMKDRKFKRSRATRNPTAKDEQQYSEPVGEADLPPRTNVKAPWLAWSKSN